MVSTTQLLSTGETVQFGLPNGIQIDLDVLQDPETGKEFVCCDLCGSNISLRTRRNLHAFGTHRLSIKCTMASMQSNQARDLAETVSALEPPLESSSSEWLSK